MRSRGTTENAERVCLPRSLFVPHYFEPVQVYRRVLFVGDVFVKDVVGIKRPEHVLLQRATERHLEGATDESDRQRVPSGLRSDARSFMAIAHHHIHPTTTRT